MPSIRATIQGLGLEGGKRRRKAEELINQGHQVLGLALSLRAEEDIKCDQIKTYEVVSELYKLRRAIHGVKMNENVFNVDSQLINYVLNKM